MTLEELGGIISNIGLPYAYGFIKQSTAPAYIVYSETYRNAIYADGRMIYAEPYILLQLYTKMRSLATERQIEAILAANGIAYDSPDYAFDETQNIHIASYYFPI